MATPKPQHAVLPPLHNGNELVVVRLPDGKLGVADPDSHGVWTGYDIVSTQYKGIGAMPRVDTSSLRIPSGYGSWKEKWIGGLSRTWRRHGILRAVTNTEGPVFFFASEAPDADAVSSAFAKATSRGDEEVRFVGGDCIHGATHGYVNEVVVTQGEDLAYAAAIASRAGAKVFLEDPERNAKRSLGIERLDRIEFSGDQSEKNTTKLDKSEYGLHRGDDNWCFSWLPEGWKPPLTWDYAVENALAVVGEDVHQLPRPLRQHAAKALLDTLDTTTKADECKELRRLIPRKREVSAGLSPRQTKQLITAFYLLEVECIEEPAELVEALRLVCFRYALERGYYARWTGKYEQDAEHIGNGDSLRNLAPRMSQYAPHRLPSHVLNKLCGRDGKLHPRGSKGSRSKYIARGSDKKRCEPKKRLKRTRQAEERMVQRSAQKRSKKSSSNSSIQ